MEAAHLGQPAGSSGDQTLSPPSRLQLRKRIRRLLTSYAVRTLFQGVLTIWAVVTFTFILIRQMPGNPVEVKIEQLMISQNMTYQEAYNRAAGLFDFDPNAPLLKQYLDYMADLLQGDLGRSITSAGTPVVDQILRYLPWTLFSVGVGLLISFTLGIFVGMAMAYWRGSVFDNVMTALASILFGIPNYITALLIILVLGVQMKWFNVGSMLGGVDQGLKPGFNYDYLASVTKHALLPVITYVSATVGGWMLTMKSSTISTLGEEYVTVAQARGLRQWRILTAYVGRNAMLPLVTRLAISIGFVVGGSVIIETIFLYPGLGKFLVQAVSSRDYTSMQGVFLVISVTVVASNMLADMMYGALDPRVRISGEK